MTWYRLLAVALIGQVLAMAWFLLAPLVVGTSTDPTAVVIALIVAGALVTLRFKPRAGAIYGLVVSSLLLLLIVVVFQGYKSLFHLDSTVDFVGIAAATVSSVLGTFAGAGAIARREASSQWLARAAFVSGGLVVLAALASGIAGLTASNDSAHAGDVRIAAKEFKFEPSRVTVVSGEVSLFLANEDATYHDFTIAGIAHVSLPSVKHRRVLLDLAPGTYPFRCTLHSGMGGTITAR